MGSTAKTDDVFREKIRLSSFCEGYHALPIFVLRFQKYALQNFAKSQGFFITKLRFRVIEIGKVVIGNRVVEIIDMMIANADAKPA